MPRLFIDFETRSEVDLKKVGADNYARHPSTEILCLSFAHGGEPVRHIDYRDLSPGFLDNVLRPGDLLTAHNSHFEYLIWSEIGVKRHGWPDLSDPARWDCTMARALMCSLPASLEGAGKALGLPVQKDLDGRAVMLKLCKPAGIYPLTGEPLFHDSLALLDRLIQYCDKDVETEMQLNESLPELSLEERKIWELDLIINRRGVAVDLDMAAKAAKLTAELSDSLNACLSKLTGGQVSRATRLMEMKKWVEGQGVSLEDGLDKAAATAILNRDDVPDRVKEVIAIRKQVGKSSTAKYQRTLEVAGTDSRVRGVLQYHAAHTGRWGGRMIQPQNYPKGLGEKEQKEAIEVIKLGNADVFELIYGDKSLETLSDCLRGSIVAGPGKKLVCADYNAIEARVLFWLAGEQSALTAYRKGESPYVEMAKYVFHNEKITKQGHPKEYAVGKSLVLGAGFGLGPVKFRASIKAQAGIEVSEELAERAIAAYREKYSAVKRMWYEIEGAAKAGMKGEAKCCGGRVVWAMSGPFLTCRLPSGRLLYYFKPEIKNVKTPWGEMKETLHYWTEDSITHKWGLEKTYGGALTENIVQATARDIMANGMLKVEKRGFFIVLTCHDELIGEIEEGDEAGKLAGFIAGLCDKPGWAGGLPLAAEGFVAERYRK